MRVISGTAKGRTIKVPKTKLRPLSDQAKEALFNILMQKVPGSSFLDLFAGSGSVGIEALSRGAKTAFFVEHDRKSVAVIKENLQLLGFLDASEVFSLDVVKALKIFQKSNGKFDIIFIGAPYGSDALEKAMAFIGENSLLKENGVVVAEHRFKHFLEDSFGSIKKIREERYGDTLFSFYKGAV